MYIQKIRSLFPVVDHCVFLNNAGESPLNLRVRQRLDDYVQLLMETPHNKPSVRGKVRRLLSGLLGGAPDEYALVTSTGAAIGIVSNGIDWQPGDNVVLPADEHWNNTFPWLALQERGVEVRLVFPDEDNRINPADVAHVTDQRTRLVAVAAVRFNSGFRTDLKALSSIAHDCGALFLVDGIQATGAVPLNVVDDGIDVLACGGFKWLLGIPGTGFLYVRRGIQEQIRPVLPGMFAADDNMRELHYLPDARRYETGSIAYPLFYAWTAGLELLQELGVDSIHSRIMHLTDRLIKGLRDQGMQLQSPVESIDERSGIVVFSAADAETNKALYDKLKSENIIIALRGGVCRVSPSFYNTEEEIDALLAATSQWRIRG